MSEQNCITHSFACDCREAEFKRMEAERDAARAEAAELRETLQKIPGALNELAAKLRHTENLTEVQRIAELDACLVASSYIEAFFCKPALGDDHARTPGSLHRGSNQSSEGKSAEPGDESHHHEA